MYLPCCAWPNAISTLTGPPVRSILASGTSGSAACSRFRCAPSRRPFCPAHDQVLRALRLSRVLPHPRLPGLAAFAVSAARCCLVFRFRAFSPRRAGSRGRSALENHAGDTALRRFGAPPVSSPCLQPSECRHDPGTSAAGPLRVFVSHSSLDRASTERGRRAVAPRLERARGSAGAVRSARSWNLVSSGRATFTNGIPRGYADRCCSLTQNGVILICRPEASSQSSTWRFDLVPNFRLFIVRVSDVDVGRSLELERYSPLFLPQIQRVAATAAPDIVGSWRRGVRASPRSSSTPIELSSAGSPTCSNGSASTR